MKPNDHASSSLTDDEFIAALSKNIRHARMLKDYTKFQFAIDAQINYSHYCNIEAGKKNISILLLKKIAETLELSARDLIPDYPCKNND